MTAMRPLFLTGPARGGTNLVARMLCAHPRVSIAIHAFQPLFRAIRNAVVALSKDRVLGAELDPAAPFHDGFFDETALAILDIVHSADLDMPFHAGTWPGFWPALTSRCGDECPDLVPGLRDLEHATSCRNAVDRMLGLVSSVRGLRDGDWVGMLDTWTIDFLPALARAYPEARFIVIWRDPRAIVASVLGIDRSDGSKPAQVLSLARHWRKMIACCHAFREMPELRERLMVVPYEGVVADPHGWAARLAAFLELAVDPAMTDFPNFVDPARRRPWVGNSSFDSRLTSISAAPAQRWRRTLAPNAASAIEFLCHADMIMSGYTPDRAAADISADPAVLDFLLKDYTREVSWRTDLRDIQRDYGYEAFRNMVLRSEAHGVPNNVIRRCFLFEGYFGELRKGIADRTERQEM